MFHLMIEDIDGKVTEVPLVRKQISIGRDEGNTIRLPERNVSRRHAKIIVEGDAVFIEDLQSFNGVWVNGQRIEGRTQIRVGDRIVIGDYHLTIAKEGEEPETLSREDKDGRTTADLLPVIKGERDDKGEEDKPLQLRAKLLLLNTSQRGKSFILGKKVKIGRAEENDIHLDHPSLSRFHAEIVEDNGIFRLFDRGSSNGCFVNGEQFEECDLQIGDIIELGDVRFRLCSIDEDTSQFLEREEEEKIEEKRGEKEEKSRQFFKVIPLIGLGMGVAILGLSAVFFLRPKGNEDGRRKSGVKIVEVEKKEASSGKDAQLDLKAQIQKAKEYADNEDYNRALQILDELLSRAPQNREALELKDQFEGEKADLEALNEALSLKSEGKFLSAIKKLKKIREGSKFYKAASELLDETKPEAIKTLRDKMREAFAKGRYYEALQFTNDILSFLPEDREAKELLKKIEAKIEGKSSVNSSVQRRKLTVKERIELCKKKSKKNLKSAISCLKGLERFRGIKGEYRREIYRLLAEYLRKYGKCGSVQEDKDPLSCLQANEYIKKYKQLSRRKLALKTKKHSSAGKKSKKNQSEASSRKKRRKKRASQTKARKKNRGTSKKKTARKTKEK